MSKNRATQGNAILVVVAMVMGTLIGLMFAQWGGRNASSKESSTAIASKMDEVLELVAAKYVDSVNMDSLSEQLVSVMLSELDPHSTYLSARATQEADERMRGNFEGVGLLLHHEGDTTFVGQVIGGGPSEGQGLLAGDVVALVDGDTMIGVSADTVVARLRGHRGTRVEIEAWRRGTPHRQVYTIARGVVDKPSIPYTAMLNDTTGYIMLSSFTSTSHREFQVALQRLKSQGMRHLVFDLRGNGGGSLSSATGIAGELLPRGSLIVYTQGEHSRRRNTFARGGGLFTEGRVTVMIDENSASASEVVCGALQDNDRAQVVGRRSFGKGLVQAEYALKDGSSVLLTTARYYTPSGRCIQRAYDNGTEEYYRSYMEQLIEETYADSAKASIKDTTPYYTVGGRIVYGGGGITPDIIFPYRKDITFVYYNRLLSSGLINRVAFDYVKRNAARWTAQYVDADAFCTGYHVDDQMIQELASRGEKEGISCDKRSLQAQRTLIATLMKAYIGQSLFGDDVFYRVYRQVDEDLNKVLKI